jgi:PAS domain S-box-containing protein
MNGIYLHAGNALQAYIPSMASKSAPHVFQSDDDSGARIWERENVFSASCEGLGIGAALLDLDGNWSSVNRHLCEMVGYSSEELLATSYGNFFHSRRSRVEDENRRRLLARSMDTYSSEKSAKRKDGREIWVRAIVSLVHNDMTSVPQGFLVLMDEITPLKQAEQALKNSEMARDELSRRMMNAQDADRTRIARELHDDIGQALAVLKIQLQRLAQPSLPGRLSVVTSFSALAAEVQAIAGKVSRLSHELHSSELEFFGLAIAIESHCREFSERFHIDVGCACHDIGPDVGGALALAFLRVLQEALHNVAKHSQASRVSVELTATPDEMILTISDDGIGFDVERHRRSPGLGLISMRERMHLVGGDFQIHSRPGESARVVARAPRVRARPNAVVRPYPTAVPASSARIAR